MILILIFPPIDVSFRRTINIRMRMGSRVGQSDIAHVRWWYRIIYSNPRLAGAPTL